MSRIINVGRVTSYADAVKGGYQGTREEWEIVLANLGTTAAQVEANRQAVAEDKATVEGDVTTVEGYKDAAAQSASEALQSAENAHTDALAATAAKEAAQTAQGLAEEARTDAVSAKGAAENAQTEANTSASAAAGSALAAGEAARTATANARAASDSATAAAQSAEAAAESARTLTIDTTMTQAGQAADAKKVGDEITDLKSALNFFENGSIEYTKAESIQKFEQISRNVLYQNLGLTIGVSKFSNITTGATIGAYALKIDLQGIETIKYPVFKTTSHYASFIFDETNTIIWVHEETVQDTGYEKTILIPSNANWMLLSISGSLAQMDWTVKLTTNSLNDLKEAVDNLELNAATVNDDVACLYGKTVTKQDAIQAGTYSTGKLYFAAQSFIGNSFEDIVPASSPGALAFIINLSKIKTVTYPVFKSNSNLGSLIFDNNDNCIWTHVETNLPTGTMFTIEVPDKASYMLLSISSTINASDWKYVLYALQQSIHDTPFIDSDKNLCLAGIKTSILSNKIPYHSGFLFHTLDQYDNNLWYGKDFDHINRIGSVGYKPTLMRFAISPKDGRIIAVQRDTRNGIWVWDGTAETHLNSFETNPMAWLYNSGVDFIIDSNNVEHCVFAEYTSYPSSNLTLNVWRGTYPYTSASDWEIVLSQTSGNVDIGHFHMVRRDPWSDILYCTSGDGDAQCNWWYSTDYGSTWTLLVNGSETGWSGQICRTINFIFTEDYVYWATDHAESTHALYKIQRDSDTKVLDLTTKTKMTDLPALYATNSLCYCETPHGLFMYDRIDTTSSSIFGGDVTMKFWSFDSDSLVDIVTLGLTENSWGGSRGKCYINYTNGKQTMPAMGFSIDTPCIFDLVCDNPSNIGTIAYDVGSKTVHTIDY